MSKDFIAHEWQDLIIAFILDNARGNVWAGMGMGKTVATLTAIEYLRLAGILTRPVLVLAPLRVAASTWPDEVDEWNHLKHLKVSAIIGDADTRLRALKTKADVYTINYENIPWLIEQYFKMPEKKGQKRKQIRKWPFGMVVADESTKLKGFRLNQGAKRARYLAYVAHKSARFVNLTGTAAPNGLIDLWGQNWFIDAGERLGRTFTSYRDRWFQRSFNGFSLDPLPHSQKEIEEKLQGACISVKPEDFFDIEEPIVSRIKVKLPPKALKIYKDMEKTMFAELNDLESVEAVNAAVKTMKCLQIANGSIYTEDGSKKYETIHDAKLDALESVIEEAAGMPVLVAYNFKSDLDRLKKRFKKGRVLDKDPKTIKQGWNAGKIPILFAHPASAGHGLNLQHGGNILCFFSVNWNLEEHDQIIERIGVMRQRQAGYDRPVFLYYITAEGTIEDLVRERLETKASVQDLLMNAMKTRKGNT